MDDDYTKENLRLRQTEGIGWMAENAEYALEGNKRLLEKRKAERGKTAQTVAEYVESFKERPKDSKPATPAPKKASSSSSSSMTDKTPDGKSKATRATGPSRFGPPKHAPEGSKSADKK